MATRVKNPTEVWKEIKIVLGIEMDETTTSKITIELDFNSAFAKIIEEKMIIEKEKT